MLTLTNASAALSGTIIVGLLHWPDIIDGYLRLTMIVCAIILCAIWLLTNTGLKLLLTKDWIVVMCKNDCNMLASKYQLLNICSLIIATNAMLVRIDLTAAIFSPIVAGLLMAHVSTEIGCILVVLWDIGTLTIQYMLLNSLYRSVPELSTKIIPITNGDQKCSLPTNGML
jgi:hypothetical protein